MKKYNFLWKIWRNSAFSAISDFDILIFWQFDILILRTWAGYKSLIYIYKSCMKSNKSHWLLCFYAPKLPISMSHMSGGLDWREKICAQKLDHSMLVQPILCRKMEKSKFFNEPFFRNRPISIFPYVKLEEKWRKNGSLRAVNCLNLFRNALNSLLNKHWHRPKALRTQSCSVQCKCAYKTLILRQKLSL